MKVPKLCRQKTKYSDLAVIAPAPTLLRDFSNGMIISGVEV